MHSPKSYPISATKHMNLEPLIGAITKLLPLSPPLFPTGQVTDRDLAFRISEMIREKLTLELDQELPYGIAVEVEAMGHDEGQLNVSAAIWVDRAGQKPIVIGAGGERLKRVGSQGAPGTQPHPGRAPASDAVGEGP